MSGLFDANFYRAANADLTNFDDAQALSHFQAYGLNEERAFSPLVNLKFYSSSNADLASFNNSQLMEHLQNYGVSEGRQFSPLVDLNFYRSYNQDLANLSNEQLLEHLRNYGVLEGRRFSAFTDLNLYRVANADLNNAGLDNKQLLEHLVNHGITEGRRFSVAFDSTYYRQNNSDLAASGLNNLQLLEHFQRFGIKEGRASSESFNVNFYLSNNDDLKIAGFNPQQAQQHFELYGFREGRRAAPANFSVLTEPGDTFNTAFNLGVINISNRSLSESISNLDGNDFYRFTLSNLSNFNLVLNDMSANADVQLFNSTGEVLLGSSNYSNTSETISRALDAGTYYLRVYPGAEATPTKYNLNLSATAIASTVADWTFMVYMAGSNLENYGIQDFLEMADVGSSANLNIVFQLDRTDGYSSAYGNWTDTRRGIVSRGSTPNSNYGMSIGEANMGDPNTLRSFLNWGMNTYQARNYALVLWGHGSGFNLAYDDITNDSISANELSGVLGSLPKNLDLVGADACLMGTTEFAYQISDYASVFVGSQENEPGTGWYYSTILADLTANPTMSATQLGSTIVNSYAQYYSSIGYNACDETLAAINLASLRASNPQNLVMAINQFASTIINNATNNDHNRLITHRETSALFGEQPNYRDLGTVLANVANDLTMTAAISSAAQTALDSFRNTIIQNYSAVNSRSTGLSIYFSEAGYFPSNKYNGDNLIFASNTAWDEFLSWANW